MANLIPQYSDFLLSFIGLTYSSQQIVDLSSAEDIILSICKNNQFSSPLLVLKNSTSASRFTLDNENKNVSVQIYSSDLASGTGQFFVNLYIVDSNGKYLTHIKENFEIDYSVKYST